MQFYNSDDQNCQRSHHTLSHICDKFGMTNVCLWCMLLSHQKLFAFTKRHTNLNWQTIVTDYLEFISLKMSLFLIHYTDRLVELLAVTPPSSCFKTISSSFQTWFRQSGGKVRYRILLFLKMACSTGTISSCHKVGEKYQLLQHFNNITNCHSQPETRQSYKWHPCQRLSVITITI